MAKSLVAAALIVPTVVGALSLTAASRNTPGPSITPQSTRQNPAATTGGGDQSSPDERARATEARMTDDERFSLLISILGSVPGGAMAPDPRVRNVKNQSAGYTRGIPRLGIPALQSSDASMGVTNPGYRPDDKGPRRSRRRSSSARASTRSSHVRGASRSHARRAAGVSTSSSPAA